MRNVPKSRLNERFVGKYSICIFCHLNVDTMKTLEDIFAVLQDQPLQIQYIDR